MGGFNGQLEMYMKKFEDPKQSDPMSRMQNDLDETKIVLVRPSCKVSASYNDNLFTAQYN